VRWNMVFEKLGIDFDGVAFETYFRDCLHTNAIPENGAIEILEYLASKYVLCTASNGPYDQQINRLRVGKMYNYFKYFFISSKIGAQKPAKEFFDRCFMEIRKEMPSIKPEETVIIGDSLTSDMAGGIQYGMQTCFYNKNGISQEKLAGVTYSVSNLLEIKDFM